jgi:signal transduction histidine kinase
MGEMTAIVAHHFNNILAVIHGRAQLVQRRIKDEQLQNSLRVIQGSVLKAGEMVRHLQDYFGEQIDMRFTDVDVNEAVSEVVQYQEQVWRNTREAEAPPVQIELELAAEMPVRGVSRLLQDAISRILLNASEAMPSGGKILVRTASSSDQVSIEVIDSGIGMSSEVQKRLFEPFFSTKGARSRGLGLSATLGIVQRHEGRVETESREGVGTTVRIVLPVESRVSRIVPVDRGEGSAKEDFDGREEPLGRVYHPTEKPL